MLKRRSTFVIIISLVVIVSGSIIFYMESRATSYFWHQVSWLGGDSTNVATHSQDANASWDEYSTKDVNIAIDGSTGSVSLAKNPDNTENTSTDFSLFAHKDATVSVENDAISLLKPNGSVCTGNDECQSGGCESNVCVFVCGNTLEYGSIAYATVLANDGRCWLQQNLGADHVATAYNDSSAYGWYYQWGRSTDGHQLPTSGATWSYSNIDVPTHGKFIYAEVGTNYDWRWPQKNTLWQGVSGINNPCPSGWRVPTSPEWSALVAAESITDRYSAYNSSLKIASAGYRPRASAGIGGRGSTVWHWSSTISGTRALEFYISSALITTTRANLRAVGYPMRCIKN